MWEKAKGLQTNAPSSSTGPKSPIRNLQKVGLGGKTNRFESLIEDPEINEEGPATLTSVAHNDVVPFLTDIVVTSISTGTPTQIDIVDQIVSNVDIPACGHIDTLVEKGAAESPQTTPPILSLSNKKSGSDKKNKRRSIL
ncbi:hypothetical protein U1Q18_039891 [Sarracenia purpurea var. burkii]